MKLIIFKICTALFICLVTFQTVTASSHREAPLISNDPLADNTDLYAFRSPTDTNKVVLIANYIPFEHPAGGPNWYTFGENIRYEIHVDNNASTSGSDIIYRFTFTKVNQDPSTFFNIRLGQQNIKTTYIVERSINGGTSFTVIASNGVVPPPNIGPRSIENATVGLGAANYDALMLGAIATASTGERIYCGPADDPFFVDLGGAFDVGNFRSPGRDGLAKFNCHSIAVEVPISTLQKNGKNTTQATSILDGDFVIGVYASASRQMISTFDSTGGDGTTGGSWVQVSRLGMPLTNEVVIPIGAKDRWNSASIANDTAFEKYFKNPELALYMDNSQFGGAVPGLSQLRIQTNSLGAYDFRNGKPGLFPLKGTPAVAGTALDDAAFGNYLLPNNTSPRAVDLLPIFHTGVPNLRPYQLATGKGGNPLAAGKPFINNFLPTFGDMLRLNMAVPVTQRNDPKFSSLGLVQAAVLGLTDPAYNGSAALQFIPNMDGFPNGRRLEDDVTTIELQAVSGVVLAAIGLWYDDYNGTGSPVTPQLQNVLGFNAGVTSNDTTFKTTFPFVQAPWRGFRGAQYSGAVLPVTWVSFTAQKVETKALLRWEVATQINNDHFEIEHSINGQQYQRVGSTQANASQSMYSFTHNDPSVNKVNYYRIKQVDKDGRFTYSDIRTIRFDKKAEMTISPNPAISEVRIYITDPKARISLYDQQGRRLATSRMNNGFATFNLSTYANGIYTAVAEVEGVVIATEKIIRQ